MSYQSANGREASGQERQTSRGGFLTRGEAAIAIAEQLHPDDDALRAAAVQCYEAKLYDDLCVGRLVGRDPDFRLPIEHRGLAGAIMFGGCVISQADLNAWLTSLGVGVSVESLGENLPFDEQLANEASTGEIDGIGLEDIRPGPARDRAIRTYHDNLAAAGGGKYRKRTAAAFGRSLTVVDRALQRTKASAPMPAAGSRDKWDMWANDPFGRSSGAP
ncbi:hypothetical protein [Burkholderia vietnamiensis]|uniref:hypothetical protein n=1 Tax=Burkholderia vietnamiensis TaxID=60552 RepID=UPI0015927970|nr:hypothetical protein [Burkholderia vietnamiensis]